MACVDRSGGAGPPEGGHYRSAASGTVSPLKELVIVDQSVIADARSSNASDGVWSFRFLMEQNDMKPADLGRLLGSRSAASMILSGKRALSKTHIRNLATHFKLDASVFL